MFQLWRQIIVPCSSTDPISRRSVLVVWDETQVYGRDYVERVAASLTKMNEADVSVCGKVGDFYLIIPRDIRVCCAR